MFRALVFAALLATTARAYAPCAEGQFEMSVEGIEGIFCVDSEPICIAEIGDGACPEIQEGLPYGSYCGRVASGVYGCKVLDSESIKTFRPTSSPPAPETPAPETPAPETPAPETPETPAPETPAPETPAPETPVVTPASGCGEGFSPMSIEGVVPIFCVLEPACVSDRWSGNCPGAQPGLEFGSYCDVVSTGVYGCRPFIGPDIESNTTYPPVRDCTGNNAGDKPVSVVGTGTFCAAEPICAGQRNGNCPPQQDGLDADSVCAVIETGVYGCVMPVN